MADFPTTKTGLSPSDLKNGELYGVLIKASGEAKPLKDEVIARKIRAAEDFYETDLAIRLQQKKVASDPDIRGLVEGTDYDLAEAAYPLDANGFVGDTFCYLRLNLRPVASISRLAFQLPGMRSAFVVPPDWIKLERKYGRIQLLPITGQFGVQLLQISSLGLTMLSAGRTLPQVIFVDYVTGFTTAQLQADHQNLLEGILLRASLLLFGIVGNVRSGGFQSGSLSEDGLSRSMSLPSGKYGPYSGAIELAKENEKDIRDSWRDHQQGVLLAVA